MISFRISHPNYLLWGGGGLRVDDTMIWQLNRSGVYAVHSFYYSLLEAPSLFSPWKSIWCVKVPKRMAFFLWTTARGWILK